jgi:hypothetical protein
MHWGKNIDRAFLHPNCPINSTIAAELAAFTTWQDKADPQRMFEPPLFKRIKAAAGPDYYPGCDMAGKCVCMQDVHCAPGFKCVASLAFPELKACKPPPEF